MSVQRIVAILFLLLAVWAAYGAVVGTSFPLLIVCLALLVIAAAIDGRLKGLG